MLFMFYNGAYWWVDDLSEQGVHLSFIEKGLTNESAFFPMFVPHAVRYIRPQGSKLQ